MLIPRSMASTMCAVLSRSVMLIALYPRMRNVKTTRAWGTRSVLYVAAMHGAEYG